MRKVLSFFALTIGVGVAVWLVIAANFTVVVHSFAQIGWGIAAIILVRAVMIMMNGVAWGELLATSTNAPFVVFPLLRWVREAIDVLLPVGSIGGSLVCARLLTFWRVSSTIAVAGVVVDVFLQTVAQIMFAGYRRAPPDQKCRFECCFDGIHPWTRGGCDCGQRLLYSFAVWWCPLD